MPGVMMVLKALGWLVVGVTGLSVLGSLLFFGAMGLIARLARRSGARVAFGEPPATESLGSGARRPLWLGRARRF